jgi:alpha-1,2-mannosyltransferase
VKVAALGWLASAALLALAFAVSPNYRWSDAPRPSPYAGDFLHEYVGGWLVRAGDPADLYDTVHFRNAQHDPALTGFTWPRDQFFQALHPPFYYQWVAPLSRLDYRSAAHLWAALGVAALVASVLLLGGSDARARPWLGVALALSLLYTPVAETLVSGQKSTFLLLLFAATYVLLARGRPALAGAVFGLVALKPQLLLVVALAMLVKRQWRFVGGMAAAGVVLAAQSLFMGWDACTGWLAAIADPLPQHELAARAHSWLGFAQLLLGESRSPAVLGLTVLLVAATALALTRVLRGPIVYDSARFRVQFSAMVLATPLVSPYLYKTYDLAIFVVPLFLLAREWFTAPPASATLRRVWLVALLAVFAMGGASAAIAERVPIQLSAVATFALLAVLMESSARTGTARTAVSA